MLNTLRKGASTWVAKILIGLLMLSFAVWGINDIFTGYRGDALITVGKTEVPGESFRTAFQSEMQRVGQRIGRPLTMDEARGLGLDGQIIGQLVTQAVMDEKGREVGLSMTDAAVANSIVTDPNFTSSNGSFDRFYFENVLRNIGLSEAQFAAERRSELVRQALGEAVVSGIPAPETLNRAVHDFASEEPHHGLFRDFGLLRCLLSRRRNWGCLWHGLRTTRPATPRRSTANSVVIALEPSELGGSGLGE
jgi:peptidyl-prolyl cis-trans isomerase D